MTVGFLHVEPGEPDLDGRARAEGMTRSVRRVMPCVPVVQFTDTATEAIAGVDDVRRMEPAPLALMRFRHQAAVTGEWLFLDTDVLVQRDVRHVFADQSFDVAITTRNWPHLRPAYGFAERMPFNAGVVFSRQPKFWRAAIRLLTSDASADAEFMGHQQVICQLAGSRQFTVRRLQGSRYNFPPYVAGPKDGGDPALSAKMAKKAAIVHYKGATRKALMLDVIRAEATACP